MGTLTLPENGSVYLDANVFIYTVERIEPYRAVLDAFWQAVRAGPVRVATSELTLLEVLVKPVRVGNAAVEAAFRAVLLS